MISVIVPIYNVEPYLRECIDSILVQSYEDFELILVDDGSPDNCGAICDEYATQDSRIRVIHQKNGGLSAARNAGLDVARGDYVTFVDSDDRISVEYLEYLYRMLVDESAEIACCNLLSCSENKFPEESEHIFAYETFLGRDACVQPYMRTDAVGITACGKLYSRQLWSDLRFPVGKLHEDQATVPIVLYKARKVAASRERLYYYRIVENSIMHKPFSLKRYDDLEAVDFCIAFFIDHNEIEIERIAQKYREGLLAVYSIYARKSGIYDQLPKEYKMAEFKALRILRKAMTDDKYTYYLAMIHPNWLLPHAYLRKIKKILHIPCN